MESEDSEAVEERLEKSYMRDQYEREEAMENMVL